MTPTYIIAEPGGTHEGDRRAMQTLIRTAAVAGCQAVKWQWTSSSARLAERRHAPEYEAAYRLLMWPLAWMPDLLLDATDHGLDTLCTVYLPEDVAALDPFVSRWKVSSFEARDAELRAAMRATGKPLIHSTGGMTAAEGVKGVAADDWVLHCTSAYPCSPDALNLRVIQRWAEHAVQRVGLSDHSADRRTGMLAVAAGATVLEVHMRLDECPRQNADYRVSLSPRDLADYVANVRFAEAALGDGIKKIEAAEAPWLRYRVGV